MLTLFSPNISLNLCSDPSLKLSWCSSFQGTPCQNFQKLSRCFLVKHFAISLNNIHKFSASFIHNWIPVLHWGHIFPVSLKVSLCGLSQVKLNLPATAPSIALHHWLRSVTVKFLWIWFSIFIVWQIDLLLPWQPQHTVVFCEMRNLTLSRFKEALYFLSWTHLSDQQLWCGSLEWQWTLSS